MNETERELPAGWTWSTMERLGVWSGGGTPSKGNAAFWDGGTIPWVSPKDMKSDFISGAEDSITEAAIEGSATKRIESGSVLLVTRSGILRHTLPVAVTKVDATVNQDLKALTPRRGVEADYVMRFVQAFNRDILHTCSKDGTTVQSIETERLMTYPVPLAPLDEQRRIVDAIEALFSDLDAGEAALRDAKARLVRYRQSVLNAAVTGDLTAEWRATHPDAQPDGLLPGGWVSAPLGEVADVLSGMGFPKHLQGVLGEAYPVFKVGEISRAAVAGQTFLRSSDHSLSDDQRREVGGRVIPKGATVFAKVGAAIALNRRAILAQDSLVDNNVMAVWSPGLSDQYLYRFMQTVRLDDLSQATAIPSIRKSDVVRIPVLIPPEAEQDVIVEEVERRLSVADAVAADVDAQLARSKRLRRSILQRAFEGQLVPQSAAVAEAPGQQIQLPL